MNESIAILHAEDYEKFFKDFELKSSEDLEKLIEESEEVSKILDLSNVVVIPYNNAFMKRRNAYNLGKKIAYFQVTFLNSMGANIHAHYEFRNRNRWESESTDYNFEFLKEATLQYFRNRKIQRLPSYLEKGHDSIEESWLENPIESIRAFNAEKDRLFWFHKAGIVAARSKNIAALDYFEQCYRDMDPYLIKHFFEYFVEYRRK